MREPGSILRGVNLSSMMIVTLVMMVIIMVVMIAHKYFVFVLIMYLYDLIVHNNLLHKHCYFQF